MPEEVDLFSLMAVDGFPSAEGMRDAAVQTQWLNNVYDRPTLPPEINTTSITVSIYQDLLKFILSIDRKSIGKYEPAKYRAFRFDGKSRHFEMPHIICYLTLVDFLYNHWAELGPLTWNKRSLLGLRWDSETSRIVQFSGSYSSENELPPPADLVSSLAAKGLSPLSREVVQGNVLKLDISNFFPSIYTHALAWVVEGDRQVRNKSMGDRLDLHARDLRTKRTDGVSIGPVTSNILAEILLRDLDEQLDALEEDGQIYYYSRAIDDLTIWLSVNGDTEEIQAIIVEELNKVSLSLNHSKTRITPYLEYHRGAIFLASEPAVQVVDRGLSSKRLETAFSVLHDCAVNRPKASVLKYGWKQISTQVTNELAEQQARGASSRLLLTFFTLSWSLAVAAPHIIPDIVALYDELERKNFRIPSSLFPKKLLSDLFVSEAKRLNTESVCWLLKVFLEQGIEIDPVLVDLGFYSENELSVLREGWVDNFVSLMLLGFDNVKITQRLVEIFTDNSYSHHGRMFKWSDFWLIRYTLFAKDLIGPWDLDDSERGVFEILTDHAVSFSDFV